MLDICESAGVGGYDGGGGDGVNLGGGLREDGGVGWDGEAVTGHGKGREGTLELVDGFEG